MSATRYLDYFLLIGITKYGNGRFVSATNKGADESFSFSSEVAVKSCALPVEPKLSKGEGVVVIKSVVMDLTSGLLCRDTDTRTPPHST